MLHKLSSLWLFVFVLLISSCVSSKKYKAATTEAQNAKTANEELTKKSNDLQAQLNDAVASNKMLTEERDRYQKETDSAQAGLKRMQSTVDDYVNNMDAVQKKAADRLADYAERGLDVQYRDGLVYVTMQDELLYRKGSNKISKDGETALASLATVLNENPKLKILVIGHTDDRGGNNPDSWTTSTERANNVVRLLRKDMKIDPSRLTAAGQGQFNALGDNSTSEGRAQNRRTEIILSPDAFPLLQK